MVFWDRALFRGAVCCLLGLVSCAEPTSLRYLTAGTGASTSGSGSSSGSGGSSSTPPNTTLNGDFAVATAAYDSTLKRYVHPGLTFTATDITPTAYDEYGNSVSTSTAVSYSADPSSITLGSAVTLPTGITLAAGTALAYTLDAGTGVLTFTAAATAFATKSSALFLTPATHSQLAGSTWRTQIAGNPHDSNSLSAVNQPVFYKFVFTDSVLTYAALDTTRAALTGGSGGYYSGSYLYRTSGSSVVPYKWGTGTTDPAGLGLNDSAVDDGLAALLMSNSVVAADVANANTSGVSAYLTQIVSGTGGNSNIATILGYSLLTTLLSTLTLGAVTTTNLQSLQNLSNDLTGGRVTDANALMTIASELQSGTLQSDTATGTPGASSSTLEVADLERVLPSSTLKAVIDDVIANNTSLGLGIGLSAASPLGDLVNTGTGYFGSLVLTDTDLGDYHTTVIGSVPASLNADAAAPMQFLY